MNRRNAVLALFTLGALPLASIAQRPGKVWRVGFLAYIRRPDALDAHFLGAFPRGMRELGYVEGKNLVIEWRFADGTAELLPRLAAELAQLKPDAIVTGSAAATRAVQNASTSIPIVFVGASDPVGDGFVASLARPGRNITGFSSLSSDISSKHLELLRSMVPKLSRVVVLVNPNNSSHSAVLKNVQAAVRKLGMTILFIDARGPEEIEQAFAQIARQKAGALIVLRDAIFNRQVRQIAELAAKQRLPTISGLREYVEAGGLMSYGTNLAEEFRRAATYVDKILKGAKPGELPVEQAAKIELVINRKTAKALGLTIPQSLLISADEVIE